MSQYWLSKHVHVCLSGDQVVILDLRGTYSAINAVDASPISKFVPGWPSTSPEAAAAPISGEDEGFVDLLNSGILTADPKLGKEATPLALELPAEEIILPRSVFEDHGRPRSPIRGRHRLMFFSSVLAARYKLKFPTLEATVSKVALRRRQQNRMLGLNLTERPNARDLAELRLLIMSYRWLKPWGYASEDRCLLDSLAYIEYLARFGKFPFWVFGVKTCPFAAHCWVQAGSIVLNDYVDRVKEFTPVMAA